MTCSPDIVDRMNRMSRLNNDPSVPFGTDLYRAALKEMEREAADELLAKMVDEEVKDAEGN